MRSLHYRSDSQGALYHNELFAHTLFLSKRGLGTLQTLSSLFSISEVNIMTLTDACKVLHVDTGVNDELITSLIAALPSYIEVTTGLSEDDQDEEPLVETVSGFLLTQWYYADHADDRALTRTINSLLKAITIRARSYAE